MRKFSTYPFLLCLLLLFVVSQGWGQILAWEFNTAAGNEVTFNATTKDANLAISSVSRGSGISVSSLGNSFASTGWDNSTLASAITADEYFQFTVMANSGYKVSLSTLDANFRRSSTGPNSFQWQYSIDGFTTAGVNIGSAISFTSTTTNGLAQTQIDLSGITELQNVANTTTITVRLYGWGASAGSGTFAIGRLTGDDLTIGGTVASAVTSSVAISAGGVGASNVNQGALNVVLQRYDLSVTAANATINGLNVTTAGTYLPSDINNLKVRYSADDILDGSDVTLSTKTLLLGAGSQVFPAFISQQIINGATGYLFVTADISGTASAGNTINLGSTSFSNISFSGTVNKTGTDPVAAGGAKTFVAITPDVVLSSQSPAVPAASIFQNSMHNVIYRFDLAVTTANATLNGVTFNTGGGTNVAGDVDSFRCWYSADNIFNAASDILLSTKTTFNQAGTHVFPTFTNQVITNGTTGYIFITANLPCGAVNGNTIVVDAITNVDISFVSANKTGTANAGGTQTITAATPANVTAANASTLSASSSVSWTNPAGCYSEIMIVAATAINTGTPTGDGTAYTDNLMFGNGTALGNGFVVYKGTSSPQVVTGLTNGTSYFYKIFTRNNSVWSAGVEVSASPSSPIMPGEIVINQMSPDYGGASDEYVELVNTTNKSLDLSTLKLNYRATTGGGTNSTTLSGTILPHSYWLLLSSVASIPVTVGKTVSLSIDGTFNSGWAAGGGQVALLRISDDVQIDGVGYGTLTGGTYAEGTSATAPPTDGGIKRVVDGADNNTNSTDFSTVNNADIYLHNSSSRLANTGAAIVSGTYSDVVVTGNASLAGAVSITNLLDFQAGILTTNNNLTLTSTANKTARVGQITSGSITGNATVERFIPANGRRAWRLLGANVSATGAPTIYNSWQEGGASTTMGSHITQAGGAGTNGFDALTSSTGGASIFSWNGSSLIAPANTNATAITDNGGAYFLFVRGNRTLDINMAGVSSNTTLRQTGALNQGNITTGVAGSSFSLIPNPYASPIDYEAVFASNPFANFYVWDAAGIGSVGGYRLINRTGSGTYTATPSSGISNQDSMRFIRSGQAFFVDGNTTFNFTEAMKSSGLAPINVYRPGTGTEEMTIDLRVMDGSTYGLLYDGVRAQYNNSYSTAVTAGDAPKLNNFSENLAILRDNKTLTIEQRPLADAGDTLFLKLWNTGVKNYRFDINPSNFSTTANLEAYIVDSYLNTSTPVSLSANTLYDFNITSNTASADANRFMIVYKASTPLPVNFTNVKAFTKGTGIQVEWNVAAEVDVVKYEVEKSTNGTAFDKAGTVTASKSKAYNWFDATPNNGANFYRIKVINKDNSSSYSNVVNVKLDNTTKGDIAVYPNPVKGSVINVQFFNQEKGTYNVQLFNNLGQQVYSSRIVHQGGSASEALQLTSVLSKGVYQLVITKGDKKVTQQVIAE